MRLLEEKKAKICLCFNPYSIGFYSLMLNTWESRKRRRKFQSLFYWILFFYTKQKLDSLLKRMCFNPYSIGFYSLIKDRFKRPFVVSQGFQSLFYWILFSYKTGIIQKECGLILFQSLFYWILFFYKYFLKLFIKLLKGFNPYSTGFSSFIRSTEQTLYFQLLQSFFENLTLLKLTDM